MPMTKEVVIIENEAIMRHSVADYIDVGTTATPEIVVMSVYNSIDENPQATTRETHYTAQKTATTITTGYKPQFPITGDMYKNEKTSEFFRDIGEEQRLGVATDYYRVRLYQPIEGKGNTFFARKFRVSIEISGIKGNGGEQMTIDGNLNSVADVVIGEFNTETKTFTAKADATPPVTPPIT